MYKLFNGDCLELMKDIDDKSIDMILCDLPYGTTLCSWDVIIPFDKLWEQYNRIIKDNGAIVLFGSQPFTTILINSQLDMFKYELIWVKNRATGFVHAKNKPMKRHENIVVFSRGTTNHASLSNNRMNYFTRDLKKVGITRKNLKTRSKTQMESRPSNNNDYRTLEYSGYPNSVLEFGKDEGSSHPTQKPVALLEYLIKMYTEENWIVLDNTMGSGSTGVAAVNTNRNFIGIEKDQEYFEKAKKRIDDAYNTRHSLDDLFE